VAIGGVIALAVGRKDYVEMLQCIFGAFKWARGAEGESKTAAVLARLPEDCIVIHDFHPIGADGLASKWNLDHIVVSPRGVFIIDTKNYRSRVVRPARKSSFTKKNVAQAQRSALEMKNKLKVWSAGALADVFVVPVVVYVLDGAFIEQTREGLVHVIPLKWLEGEIAERHPRRPVSADETIRIAQVLFSQLELHVQEQFRAELIQFGRTLRAPESRLHAEKASAPARDITSSYLQGTCPLCGGNLVERLAKQGTRAGKRFLGCSNFRSGNCRYVLNLED
jgi:hypothetical protein